jgi:hypothetical protein
MGDGFDKVLQPRRLPELFTMAGTMFFRFRRSIVQNVKMTGVLPAGVVDATTTSGSSLLSCYN